MDREAESSGVVVNLVLTCSRRNVTVPKIYTSVCHRRYPLLTGY